jgi:Domain of unknown function (DUF4381)
MDGIIKNKDLQKNLANQVHDMMLGKLQDIEGVDSINIFPLAPGWWLLLIVIGILLTRHLIIRIRKILFMRTWQYKILQQLDELNANCNKKSSKEIIIKLSAIIRRLAMHRYSRNECASLEGRDWLLWLKEHDSVKFDWVKYGKILVEYPYTPENKNDVSSKEISRLINAIKNWVV